MSGFPGSEVLGGGVRLWAIFASQEPYDEDGVPEGEVDHEYAHRQVIFHLNGFTATKLCFLDSRV